MPSTKLYQIVRLREMLKRWRRKALRKKTPLSFSDVRSAASGRFHTARSLSLPSASHGSSKGARVPPGHLAVYVGEERQRFVIKMSYLSHPLFKALLKKTEEEMGFHHEGALAIPCQVPLFEHLLQSIHSSKSHNHNFLAILHLSHHHHRHPRSASANYALAPQFEELLPFSSLDSTHHLSLSTFYDASSLCYLTHSLSNLDVSSAASQAVLV